MRNTIFRSLGFRLLLIGCLLQLTFIDMGNSRENIPVVRNTRHVFNQSQVTIHYDLSDKSVTPYHVSLVMLDKNDNTFRYVPQHTRGDIGDDISAGTGKIIQWDMNKEFPDGLTSTGYYFSVEASADTGSSISPWVWVGGALVIGGAVVLLSKKSNDEAPNIFPEPPGRP